MTIVYLSIGALTLGVGLYVALKLKKRELATDKVSAPRNPLLGKIKRLGPSQSSDWDLIEESLLAGDLGAPTTALLMERAKKNVSGAGEEPKGLLSREMIKLVDVSCLPLDELLAKSRPLVISIVGINGAGKTTTIGKLAHYFKSSGKTVLLGAADTFRAGAIAQLKTWADRVGVDFVTGREGADPGAVAFDSVSAGKARDVDVVLLDTAGRLHTKSNLMDELKKIHKVVKKVIPEAPHETWLVLDGTLGQNSLNQAKEFQQTLGITGIIVTKLDGTSKGGAVFPISKELALPVRFIGVGEGLDDLIPFQAENFVQAILG